MVLKHNVRLAPDLLYDKNRGIVLRLYSSNEAKEAVLHPADLRARCVQATTCFVAGLFHLTVLVGGCTLQMPMCSMHQRVYWRAGAVLRSWFCYDIACLTSYVCRFWTPRPFLLTSARPQSNERFVTLSCYFSCLPLLTKCTVYQGNYAFAVTWSDGHTSSLYTYDTLTALIAAYTRDQQ